MNRMMATIGVILMLIAIPMLVGSCATAVARGAEMALGIDKEVEALMKEANTRGSALTEGVNNMSMRIGKMEPGIEKKSARIAITELKRIATLQFNAYTLFKIAPAMKHPADTILMFIVADNLIKKIQNEALSYAAKSALRNAADSKNRELIDFVDKAIKTSDDISELYRKMIKLFYGMLKESMLPNAETFKI